MYQLRAEEFSYGELGFDIDNKTPNFEKMITKRNSFRFCADDIIHCRHEFRKLLENLSAIYLPWKENEERKRREEKKQARFLLQENLSKVETKLKENSNGGAISDAIIERPSDQKNRDFCTETEHAERALEVNSARVTSHVSSSTVSAAWRDQSTIGALMKSVGKTVGNIFSPRAEKRH